LARLQQVENDLGRQRTERWSPRTIDLDLLLYGDLAINTAALVVPHPRMAWRRFVLEPAAEVAGQMLHPMIGWTIARLLEHLNTTPAYVAVTGPIAAGKTQLAERLAAALSARLLAERPDWNRLEHFYADPAAHAWQTELDFLSQRASLLEAAAEADCGKRDGPIFADGKIGTVPRWTVSDFWFDQSAAFARAWLPEDRLPAFLEQFERLRARAARPRLVVLLNAPAEVLLDRVRSRGRPCERPLTREILERIRRAVIEQAERPDVGPVLRADGGPCEAVLSEVLAAVRGME
jgi:deoxyguanosine kinase